MRNFFKILIAIALFFSITMQVPFYIGFNQFFSADTYTKSLNDSGIYKELNYWGSDEINRIVKESFNEAISEEVAAEDTYDQYFSDELTNEVFLKVEDLTADFFNQFVSEEAIQDLSNNNIVVFFDFLNGKYEEPVVYLPKEKFIDDIQRELPTFMESIKQVFKDAPTCTEQEVQQELNDPEYRLSCIPSDVKANLDELFESDFENDIQTEIDRIKEDVDNLGEGDIVTLSELNEFAESETPEQDEELIKNLNELQDGYQLSKTVITVSMVIPFFLAVIFILLVRGNVFKKLFEISIVLFISFSAIVLVALPAKIFAETNIDVRDVNFEGDLEDLPEPLIDAMTKTVQGITSEVIDPILMLSLIVMFVSFVDIIAAYNFMNRNKQAGRSNENSNAIEEPVQNYQPLNNAGIERN